jgi:hypothetical protein
MNDLVSLYRCTSCGKFRLVEQGNHHPWCISCPWDIFDWSNGYTEITREEAKKIMEMEE